MADTPPPGQKRGTVYRPGRQPVDSPPVRQARDATPLGLAVLQGMADVGMTRQVELATASGLSESTITRILYEERIPERRTLAVIEATLEQDPGSLDVYVQPGGQPEKVERKPKYSAPIVAELNRLLADDSPLSTEAKNELALVLDRIVEGYRIEARRTRHAV